MQELDEKLSLQFMGAFEHAMPTDGCPEPGVFLDAVAGALANPALLALIDHTTDCPVCADAWRLAHLVGAQPPEEDC